jgi:GNAT superfamily N-acetyltransferase
VFEEHALDVSQHERARFSCGVAPLDDFLQRFATQQIKKNITNVWVVVHSDAPRTILGFYTLSAAQVDASALSERDRKSLPRYPIPCFRVGRLAVSAAHQGQGLGKLLVGLAVSRCIEAQRQVAAYAVLVDAKDEKAKAFYEHFGFVAFANAGLTLYLPLGGQNNPRKT